MLFYFFCVLCQLLSGFSILDNPFGFLYVYIMCYTSKLVVARVCSSVSLVSTSVSLFFLFDDVHFRFCKLFFVFIILYDSHKPGESVKFLHQVRSQWSCIYVLRVFILPLSTIFFGIFLMAWYFVFPLISNDSIMYIQGQRKYFKCNTL